MKSALITYLALGLATFIWQLFVYQYFGDCEFNAGACAASVRDYGLNALIWPAFFLS